MKKHLSLLAFSMLLSFTAFSQIKFESGYFINNDGQKTECLIRNADWKNSPVAFEYKLGQDTLVHKGTLETVSEFGINGVSKFIRAKVNIDRSSDNIPYMSSEKNPVFKEELLYLKVLIEGGASLYQYTDGNLVRFFYSTKDTALTQLVYKRYLVNNKITENNTFRQQLFVSLKCQAISQEDFENLKYNNPGLKQLFAAYNECTKTSYVNREPRQKRDFFNLTVRPGLNYSNFYIDKSASDTWDGNFGNKFNFRFGVEFEYILPYNKNKWGIIAEPTYQSYKSEITSESSHVSGGILISKINYHSIEIPIGVRYYLFLTDQSRIFADITYTFDVSFRSRLSFIRKDGSTLKSLEILPRRNLGFEIGYKLKNRYSAAFRYQLGRELLGNDVGWNSSYTTWSLMLGYTLF